MAEVTVSFDAWKTGHAEPTQHRVPVDLPKPGPKLEPVSSALRQELIHPTRDGFLTGLRFSPDGRRILAANYPSGTVVVWETVSGKQLAQIESGYSFRSDANYTFATPDWRTLFVSSESSQYNDVEQDGKRLLRWQANERYAPGTWQQVSSGGRFNTSRRATFAGWSYRPMGRSFSPMTSQRVFSRADQSRSSVLWSVSTRQYRSLPTDLRGQPKFLADGRTLIDIAVDANNYATAIKWLDTATAKEVRSVPVRDKNTYIAILATSPGGRWIIGDYQVYERPKKWDRYHGCLKWWDAGSGRELASVSDPPGVFGRAAFSPDGQTLVVSQVKGKERNLLFFHVADRCLIGKIPLGTMGPLVFSPDGKWLAVQTRAIATVTDASDVADLPQPRIHLVDVAAGTIRQTLIAPQTFGSEVCFSPDGRVLASSGYGKVLLWDLSGLPSMAAGSSGKAGIAAQGVR